MVHTDEDPVIQQFQKNWSSGWSPNFKKFFISLLVDHSVISSCSLSKCTIDHSPPDLFRNSPSNSNMPSPLNDFPQHLHNFTSRKTPSQSQLSNTSFDSLISPSYFSNPLSIPLTEPVYNPSLWDPTSGLATEPLIHFLNSPLNDSFILYPQPQPADCSIEGLNWESFTNDFPSQPVPSMTNHCDLYDNAPVSAVSAPHVQTAQQNPHSQLSNTPLSAQGVALGPIAKHNQMLNSPLSSLTSSPGSQASSPGIDVTSEQVLHSCHIAGCSEGIIRQAKQNHEPGLLTMILNYQVIEEVLPV